jgi:prefoldin subunit 5
LVGFHANSIYYGIIYRSESNKIMSHKDELTERARVLQSEIQELNRNFELKKEEFLKVQGALEMLQILENEKGSKET